MSVDSLNKRKRKNDKNTNESFILNTRDESNDNNIEDDVA